MVENRAKHRLQSGETAYGCFVRFPQAGLAEMLALQGWDFLVLDGEHGVFEASDVEHIARACERHDVACIFRVPPIAPALLGRFLDTGISGVHVPTVVSAEHAAAIVQYSKYHPIGTRGLAGSRAADYAQREPLSKYIERANAQTLLAVHIETRDAIDHLAAICATPHIDVIFIGPTDLSNSYGAPGDLKNPRVQAAMDRIVEETLAAKKTLGVMVSDIESAKAWEKRGARYLTVTLETMLRGACQGYLNGARSSSSSAVAKGGQQA